LGSFLEGGGQDSIPEWMLKFKGTPKWNYWIKQGIIKVINGKYYTR